VGQAGDSTEVVEVSARHPERKRISVAKPSVAAYQKAQPMRPSQSVPAESCTEARSLGRSASDMLILAPLFAISSRKTGASFMRRAISALSLALLVASLTTTANGQQLTNKGILVSQIMARTRFGVFERGDLVHVTVHQPAGNKGFTLSVHAEYVDGAGKWRQVPPPKNMLAALYTSGNYGGLRDYVDIAGVSEATERNIALFMPFDGFALPQGTDYTFRYVLRLWEPRPDGKDDDKEIAHLSLEPYRVHVGHDSEGILISALNAGPSAVLAGGTGTSAIRPSGVVRFFDTATGMWESPTNKSISGKSISDQASARK
jgi:hypothetical protein